MSRAAEVAQAFERVAAAFRQCPDLADNYDGDTLAVTVPDGAAFDLVVAELGAEPIPDPGSGYRAAHRWFGPVEVYVVTATPAVGRVAA